LNKRDNIILACAALFVVGAAVVLLRVTLSGEAGSAGPLIEHVSGYNFDDTVLKSELPVLVDFWAEWCPPCRKLTPIITDIASETEGMVKVVKVNVDEARPLAERYNIRVLPTLIIFKYGTEMERTVGFLPRDSILALLKKYAS